MKDPTITTQRPIDGGCELALFIDPGLFWFQGHFPELPLLPGVVQLDWALRLASRHLGVAVDAAPRFQVKYKSGIFPGDRLILVLRHDPVKARLNFEYRRGEAVCSSGSLAVPS